MQGASTAVGQDEETDHGRVHHREPEGGRGSGTEVRVLAGPRVPLRARPVQRPRRARALGISYFRIAPSYRIPFGYKHEPQEEVYLLLGGSARVPAETMRGF